jgi:hypothetical protein
LPPASTENLIQRVRAAIYLSLDKLWEIPSEISLIATILDPRMKNFPFANSFDRVQQRTQAEFLLRNLYTQLKQDSINSENTEEHISTAVNLNDDNAEDIFAKMWANDQIVVEDEVTRYLSYPDEPKNIDPLIWWQRYQISYPFLSQLARKYLSIPATSVPSE